MLNQLSHINPEYQYNAIDPSFLAGYTLDTLALPSVGDTPIKNLWL
jgi:hypothetical protein